LGLNGICMEMKGTNLEPEWVDFRHQRPRNMPLVDPLMTINQFRSLLVMTKSSLLAA
jgi:hypothetical protein